MSSVHRDTAERWSAKTIAEGTSKIMDYRGRTPRKLGMAWGDGSIPALSARNVRMGRIDFSEECHLGSQALYARWMTNGDTEAGDTLVTTEAPLGNVAPVPDDRKYILSQRTVLLRPKPEDFDKTYFLKYLQSPIFQRLLMEHATGSTALGIQRKRLEQLRIAQPPLAQQRAIGSALSDADELIASFERSIEKKQAIKQGMMQQLLTGRTRLPGFDEDWTEARLGQIATTTMGQSPRGTSYNAERIGIPLIQGNADIDGRRTIDRVWTSEPTKRCRAGDVILTVRAPVGFAAVASRDSCLGRGVCSLSTAGSNRFLFHALVHAEPRWSVFEQGSTFTAVNSHEVRAFTVTWPSSDRERAAISKLLDDVDEEIGLLRVRLNKARAVMGGMAQDLLTGRTRLAVGEVAS